MFVFLDVFFKKEKLRMLSTAAACSLARLVTLQPRPEQDDIKNRCMRVEPERCSWDTERLIQDILAGPVIDPTLMNSCSQADFLSLSFDLSRN